MCQDNSAHEAAYLRERNRAAGDRFRQDVNKFVKALAEFPSIGQEAMDLPLRAVRRFVMGDYHIYYEVGDEAIQILTIRHGRERPPNLPMDDDRDFEAP